MSAVREGGGREPKHVPEHASVESAGVPVEHHEYGGMIHGFVSLLDQLDA